MSPNQALYDRIFNSFGTIDGWCTEAKACRLADAVLATKAQTAVEVGVFGGKSLIPMAMACDFQQKGVCWGIDPWRKQDAIEDIKDEAHINWWKSCNLELTYQRFMAQLIQNNITHRCNHLRGSGEFYAQLFPAKSIDVLHIDGNHSEKKSIQDVNLWLPKVRKGGYVFFDDIAWGSTKKAVALIKKQCKLVEEHFERKPDGDLRASYAYFIKK